MEPGAIDPTSADRPGNPSGPTDVAQPQTDGQLVLQTLEGDRSAFDVLIGRYQRQAVAVSYRLLGSTHDALEVTQDSFLKGFKSLSTLQNPDAFGGWLLRIVGNLSLNYRRSRKLRKPLSLDDSGDGSTSSGGDWTAKSGDPVRDLQSREMRAKLQQAMASLPEKQRLALVMFTIEEIPQKQIAETLNCSVEAIKWHVFQGRKKLKELLKDHLQD